MRNFAVLSIMIASFVFGSAAHAGTVRVGSKAFTEGYLLAEIGAQKIEVETGQKVERRFGLGNTGITLEALKNGSIDVYPEYTGTISEALLKNPNLRDSIEFERKLDQAGFVLSQPLGFQNTYALAVSPDFAQATGISKISELRGKEGSTRFAFSHEFMNRSDGAKALAEAYGLNIRGRVQSLDHVLTYTAVEKNKADVIAVYSTDAMVKVLGLVMLGDDLQFFPPYHAAFLAKKDFPSREPKAWAALNALASTITEEQMQTSNGRVDRDHEEVSEVANAVLGGHARAMQNASPIWTDLKQRTLEHLSLVGIAFAISLFVGVPLGVVAHRSPRLGTALLAVSAVIQTIPSLALLALMIPLFGIGMLPAVVALCLYSLLPVVLNTLTGLQSIDPKLIETAKALGLPAPRRLLSIEIPIASRTILAGLRTSVIIGIGTATLAALIGAGGYGAPIVSGLATNNIPVVLSGAIPCALMALVAYALFDLAGRLFIPKGLRS